MNPETHVPDEEPPLESEAEEERDWLRMAAEQFFKGYAESDDIYDLPDP